MKHFVRFDQPILSCVEFYFLLTVSVTFIYTTRYIFQFANEHYVNQFETFAAQVEATSRCGYIEKLESYSRDNGNGHSTEDLLSNNKTNNVKQSLVECPIDEGRLKYFKDLEYSTVLEYQHIQIGGHFEPIGCKARQKIAIIIPYRVDLIDRLEKFSLYIHQFLPDQLSEYTLYVIEQSDDLPFNQARLFDIGFAEVSKLDPQICCFIFHDVNLLPLDQRNLYMCSTRIKHLSAGIDVLRYNPLYSNQLAGVFAMSKTHFKTIGGLSEKYTGKSGEDGLLKRIAASDLLIERSTQQHGVYLLLKDEKMKRNPSKYKETENGTGLESTKYQVQRVYQEQLYTVILVNLSLLE